MERKRILERSRRVTDILSYTRFKNDSGGSRLRRTGKARGLGAEDVTRGRKEDEGVTTGINSRTAPWEHGR